jgi:catechol 2,3-dioxygenase-like lactoylglutathione lyase family enzyme
MTITLNHTIVPAHDKQASAQFFAEIFGLGYMRGGGHFAPVQVNDTLTLDFAEAETFGVHHYAFHVDDEEFDAILVRVRAAGLPYGSEPWSLANGRLNHRSGGRGFYFRDPNGHVLELMTRV